MNIEKINFNGYIVEANSYDNTGAHNMLKSMMQRGDNLTIKFFTDKWGFPCIWVESRQIKGFKYRLSEQSLAWVSDYMFKAEFEDAGINPMELEQEKEGEKDFQESLFKLFIKEEYPLQVTPLFRERNGYISASSSFQKVKVLFSLKRTEEMLDFIRESGIII